MNHVDETPSEVKQTAWKEKRKSVVYYAKLKDKYEKFINGNEFFTIPKALNAVNIHTISLLTANVKSQKLIGVSRETMEEVLKSFSIAPKVLARRLNAMWDILLASKQEADH